MCRSEICFVTDYVAGRSYCAIATRAKTVGTGASNVFTGFAKISNKMGR